MSETGFNAMFAQFFYGSQARDRAEAVAEGKATKLILAADGVSAEELMAFEFGLQVLGLSDEDRKAIMDFDPAGARLEDVLPGYEKDGALARVMLYNAVLIASVDGFGDKERAMARKAGELMGIPADTISAITDLVALERHVTNLRHSLLKARSLSDRRSGRRRVCRALRTQARSPPHRSL